jgi:hypothetical protein
VDIQERVSITALNDGTLLSMEVKGELAIHVGAADAALAVVSVGGIRTVGGAYTWKVHPQCDKAKWTSDSVLAPLRPLPCGAATTVLRWHAAPKEDSAVPLSVSCWPAAAPHGMMVTLEANFSQAAGIPELKNVSISVPVPSKDVPEVGHVDGDYRLESGALVWLPGVISAENSTTSVEFASLGASDASVFFPINISFSSPHCFSGLEIIGASVDGKDVPLSQQVTVIIEKYSIETAGH